MRDVRRLLPRAELVTMIPKHARLRAHWRKRAEGEVAAPDDLNRLLQKMDRLLDIYTRQLCARDEKCPFTLVETQERHPTTNASRALWRPVFSEDDEVFYLLKYKERTNFE